MEAGKSYHLYTHANGFENLFRSQENYRYFLERYQHFITPIANTQVYCLMPNHIHFLVQIKSVDELNASYHERHPDKPAIDPKTPEGIKTLETFTIRQFSHLFNGYTQAYNKMYDRMGSLFMHSFKRQEITSDSYFTKVIHYIHANPVHHGFVKAIIDWPWSSYPTLKAGESSAWLDTEFVLGWFGGKDQFIEFHQQPIEVRTPDHVPEK